MGSSCCCGDSKDKEKKRKSIDILFWGSLLIVAASYSAHFLGHRFLVDIPYVPDFVHHVYSLANKMWWGLFLGIVFIGLLSKVPREFVIATLGRKSGLPGILRATLAGLLLDLCNHGILMVGMKLYERGASLGQTLAFLIASPWNSISLTLILMSLIGVPWTLAFIFLSGLVAIISGLVLEALVRRNVLPQNPHRTDLPQDFHFWNEARTRLKQTRFTPTFIKELIFAGISESRMVLRWILFGAVLAALVQTFVPDDIFGSYFGPTLIGLAFTLIVTTILEVCSEGSSPIAADLLLRAHAPGNSFTFLMAGASTDYTEIMALKETTGSWKIALFLPLVTVPQILVIGYLLNTLH